MEEFDKNENNSFGLTLVGWLISLCAFALGFYHTAEGVSYLKPLGLEYGGFILSGLISLMLILAYSRAVQGVKIALFFYLVCATFNFVFNLNSFYPNMNSRKLLQEEALQIKDTILLNLSKKDKIIEQADAKDIINLESSSQQCIDEIKKSQGFGENAKKHLNSFNNLTSKYGIEPITAGSYDVKNPNASEVFGNAMNKIIADLRNGLVGKGKVGNQAYNSLNPLITKFEVPRTKNATSPADSIFKEISDNSKTKDEDGYAYAKSVKALEDLVKLNDNMAQTINGIKLKDKSGSFIKMANLNTKGSELLFPKCKEVGKFNHTIDSMYNRLDKLDTWGVIILVFFIDFIIPLGIYFLIRRNSTNNSKGSLIGHLFPGKKPEKF